MAQATAEMIVARGGRVAILDRPASVGQAVADELKGTFHPCDIYQVPWSHRAARRTAWHVGVVPEDPAVTMPDGTDPSGCRRSG